MDMAHEYINRRVIAATMELLQEYRHKHPDTRTPMRDAMQLFDQTDRGRFKRAAQQLGWNVIVCRGRVYENGVLCW